MQAFVREFPGAASALALIVGDLVLLGWRSDVDALKTFAPGFTPMNPLTALALALGGLALWLLREGSGRWSSRIGRSYATLIAGIGAVGLIGHYAGWDRGIDTIWLVPMAATTAAACMFGGASMALVGLETRRGQSPAQSLAVAAMVVTVFALVRHAIAANPPKAVHEAGAYFILSMGILLVRPREGFVGAVLGTPPWKAAQIELVPAALPPRARLRFARVELRAIAEEVIGELQDAAPGRSIEWRVGKLPSVVANEPMVRELLTDLLTNATRSTAATTDPLIEVGSMTGNGKEVVIFVRDNGLGITDALGGTGLNRATRIVEDHGGRAWPAGRAGSGSTFCFSLPARTESAAQAG